MIVENTLFFSNEGLLGASHSSVHLSLHDNLSCGKNSLVIEFFCEGESVKNSFALSKASTHKLIEELMTLSNYPILDTVEID